MSKKNLYKKSEIDKYNYLAKGHEWLVFKQCPWLLKVQLATFFLVTSLSDTNLMAGVLRWDTLINDGTVITEGTGIWSNGTGNWNNGGVDVNWNNANSDDAIFGGGNSGVADAVVMGSNITASSISFSLPFSGLYSINTSTFGLTLNSGFSADENATIQSSAGGSIILGGLNNWSIANTKTLIVSAPILGAATGLTKNGEGKLVLSGNNFFTGDITINAGSLTVQGISGVLATPSTDPLGSNAITLNGGSLDFRDDGDGTTTTQTLGYDNSITVAADSTMTADRISGSATSKTIRLTNLSIGASTLTATSANAYIYNFSGTTLLTGNAVFNNTATITLTGVVSDGSSSFGLTKRGTGILVLGTSNTYDGGTVIQGGTLRASSANAFGTGTITSTATSTLELRNANSAAISFTMAQELASLVLSNLNPFLVSG